jgi:hypothetical protein
MAVISKSGTPSLTTLTPCPAHYIAGDLVAGEALGACDPCYIKNSDGKVYKSNGTAVAEAAEVHGWTTHAVAVGKQVTLVRDVIFGYGSGLTPGAKLFVAATAGALDTVATTGGTKPVAVAVNDKEIEVWQSRGY